ncbi:hypothetical protein CAC42_4757 [Sphaceloma murrayae]|uniref:Uncharacterized protein n=1 Tax=Sphaceloma murrayae TaxID=2082308 RepID=A0A2K1QPJ1_9PEZI|nr:hypothetical protein CAC42_4757 [Sphaceloma murrayae]
MKYIAFVAAAAVPLASALKQSSSGGAKVVNMCSYDIPLRAVPALGTGIENAASSDTILAANNAGSSSEWQSPWIQLLVAGGWSIKLNTIDSWTNIMQFEYTWADDNQVWFDNSFVDGIESQHPKWKLDCPNSAEPCHNKAYQHSTDDAAGMQKPVPPQDTITLILCPENAGSSSSSSAPAPSSTAAPSTTTTPTTTTTTPPPTSSTTFQTSASTTSSALDLNLKQANVQASPAAAEDQATPVKGKPDVVIEYETMVVTAIVTETAHARVRRHEHRHPHGHHL